MLWKASRGKCQLENWDFPLHAFRSISSLLIKSSAAATATLIQRILSEYSISKQTEFYIHSHDWSSTASSVHDTHGGMIRGFEKHWAISSEQFAFHYVGLALPWNKIRSTQAKSCPQKHNWYSGMCVTILQLYRTSFRHRTGQLSSTWWLHELTCNDETSKLYNITYSFIVNNVKTQLNNRRKVGWRKAISSCIYVIVCKQVKS